MVWTEGGGKKVNVDGEEREGDVRGGDRCANTQNTTGKERSQKGAAREGWEGPEVSAAHLPSWLWH